MHVCLGFICRWMKERPGVMVPLKILFKAGPTRNLLFTIENQLSGTAVDLDL